jgi:hypothetical protein
VGRLAARARATRWPDGLSRLAVRFDCWWEPMAAER